jgi:hypothetical protein
VATHRACLRHLHQYFADCQPLTQSSYKPLHRAWWPYTPPSHPA